MSKTIEFNVFRGSENGEIIPDTVRRTIQPREVFVEISHAGLCGTDRHFKRRPIVLGHEGAGVVRDVGSAVTLFHPGDKVGFGWVQKVCGHCDYCITGRWSSLLLLFFRCECMLIRDRQGSILRPAATVRHT